MKNNKIVFLGTFFLIAVVLTSCNPTKKDKTPTPLTEAQSDQSGTTEVNSVMDDVNDLINNSIGGGSNKKMAAYNLPCGVVKVDSTGSGANKYTFTYGNSTPCGYKYKSGTVSFGLQSGTAFNQQNAVFTITFTDYKVEVKATGSIIIVNGSISVTNITGGYIWEAVTNSSTITHRIRGSVNITYSNNAVRPRSYYQLRTWASTGGWPGLNLTIAGDTTPGSVTISEIGKTYNGNYDYQTEISTSFQWFNTGSTYAGPYILEKGHAKMNVSVPNITNTYIDVEAGYYWDLSNLSSTPGLVQDSTSNAYKITEAIGSNTATIYQLY